MPRSHRWTHDDDLLLARLYASEDLATICQRLSRTLSAVQQRASLLRIRRPSPLCWSSSENDFLLNNYPDMPTADIARDLGRTFVEITAHAQVLGVKKRRKGCRYTVAKDLFATLTPDLAYVVGFILADGCVKRDCRSFGIVNTDREIMEKMAGVLGTNAPVRSYQRPPFKTVYSLRISDALATARLLELGICPNKSLVATLPPICDELFHHFLRGYFDGDGHAHLSKALCVTFVSGSKPLLDSLALRLHHLVGVAIRVVFRHHNDRGWLLTFASDDSMRLARYMYTPSSDLFIARKRLAFERYERLHAFSASSTSSARRPDRARARS